MNMKTNLAQPEPKAQAKTSKRKSYVLDIENWGDDSYSLASKGHHDIKQFKAECFKDFEHIAECLKSYDSPCEHLWYKRIPFKEGYENYYVPVREGARGAIPVTIWWE